jgi:hypothetical protein
VSSQLYPKAREKFLTGQLSWLSGTYRAILLPESYSPNFDNEFLSDVFEGVRLSISDPITSRTATNGVASSAAVNFGVLVDNRAASKIILFKDTLIESTSDLLCFIDAEELQGAPVSLVGFEYFFVPSVLNGGIFRL